MAAAAAPVLVVWDFDWSLVNENSDTFVIEQLEPSGKLWSACERRLRKGAGWTELMDWALGELHGSGCSPDAIAAALGALPLQRGAREALALAQRAGAEQRILSDANSEYIARTLEAQSLGGAFARVETNPAHVDAAGRLRVAPHQPEEVPHGCANCPVNLCKGAVLERWLEEQPGARCVYVGDGGGDFCAATRLRAGDLLLARRAPHDGLLKKCRRRRAEVSAAVMQWGGSEDPEGLELRGGFERFLGEV